MRRHSDEIIGETKILRDLIAAIENLVKQYQGIPDLEERYSEIIEDIEDTKNRLARVEQQYKQANEVASTADLDMKDKHGQKPN